VSDRQGRGAARRRLLEDPARLEAERPDRGERMFVSHVALCEMMWVLAAVFRLPKNALVEALTDVIRTAQFVVEDPDLAARAVSRYEHGRADFADYVIAERSNGAGCEQVATFDEKLLAEAGFVAP